MKLRMKSNSIRIRVSQTELKEFRTGRSIEEEILMGPGQSLTYGLVQSETDRVKVNWSNSRLEIMVPEELASMWCDTEIVGFDETVDLESGQELYVLVEKDFQCLKPRAEDESDLFANPEAIDPD